MTRRDSARIEFDALALEGGLLPPEWLGRVAALEAPAQKPPGRSTASGGKHRMVQAPRRVLEAS